MEKIFKNLIGPSSSSSSKNQTSSTDITQDPSSFPSASSGRETLNTKDKEASSSGSSGMVSSVSTTITTTSPVKLGSSSSRLDDPEVRLEEKLRQKAFAHYDCQSMTASIHGASNLQQSLSKRRNTTTGASAASMVTKNPSLEGVDEGDGKCNDLVLSCPYFRNEIGGEEERVICLSRQTASSFNEDSMGQVNHAPVSRSRSQDSTSSSTVLLHRPNMAAGLSLLEDANERRWRLKSCPYQKLTNEKSFIIENFDIGATYYRERFYGTEHQNWFGVDDSLGPIAISIRKEKVAIVSSSVPSSTVTSPTSEVTTPVGTTSGPVSLQSSTEGNSTTYKYQYRLIIRTSELSVLRGCVFESCIPGLSSSSSRHNHHLNHHAKEVIEYLFPEISLPCLRLGVLNADEQLLKLDEQVLTTTYKVGVLFCKDNQSSEQEMYNNENSSAAFDEFLSILGEKVRLKGFSRYRGGLDNKTDTSGTHSIYKTFNDCEVMFHVSTLLPFTPNNKQQLLRKSRIGNDIVTIIFQEANAKPFTPKDNFKSHFQHVFIVVRQLPSSGQGQPVKYAVAVMRSKEVPVFGPPIPEGGIFTKSKGFSDFLLAKIINAENAAHKSEKFRLMAQRTRHEYLKDLASNHVTNTTINDVSIGTSAGAKLVSSIFGASKKSRSLKSSHFIGDSVIKGAIMWDNLSVEDFGQSKVVDCLLGISSDTLLIMEEPNKELIFVIPNASILGWSSHPSYIRIYYHQGECILVKCKDPDLDEIAEIVSRLRSVSPGVETQEMILRRNAAGQLGFHVNHEGIVTEVEEHAFAWQAGLRSNYRIVEICKVAIATLDLDQVQDLLKTSVTVTVTVVPPNPQDGSPRRGCNLTNCSYLTSLTGSGDISGEYENISGLLERTTLLASSNRRKKSSGRFQSPSKSMPFSNANSVQQQAPSSSMYSRAVHHQPFLSGSTPVSPENQNHFSIAGRASAGMSSMRLTKASTLKASPSSAFSPLSPAISLSEFSHHSVEGTMSARDARYGFFGGQNSGYFTGHQGYPSQYGNRHHYGVGGPLVKTRSEISLTNPSPPPTMAFSHGIQTGVNNTNPAFPGRRRYPSPSRSHSQYLPVKPPTTLVLSNNNNANGSMITHLQNHPPPQMKQLPSTPHQIMPQSMHQQPQQPPVKPKVSSSGYYSDSSSSDVWSLPPYIAGQPTQQRHPPLLQNGVAHSQANSLESRESLQSHPMKSNYSSHQPLQGTTSMIPPGLPYQSHHQRTVSKVYSSNGSSTSSRSASERLKVKKPINGTVAPAELQQDLLKLISPEGLTSEDNDASSHQSIHSGTDTVSTTQYSTPYSSLERPKINGDHCYDSSSSPPNHCPPSTSSHYPLPHVTKPPRSNTLYNFTSKDTKEMEWGSLVDTATKALTDHQSTSSIGEPIDVEDDLDDDEITNQRSRSNPPMRKISRRIEESINLINDLANDRSDRGSASSTNGSPSKTPTTTSSSSEVNISQGGSSSSLPPPSLKTLEATVCQLQSDLHREQTTNATLEQQVSKLKEENQRLQEESETAAAQLRKFTEWFFQNINAK